MRKKKDYEEYNGLFRNATDYAVYHMKKGEVLLGLLIGGAVGSIIIMIFFQVWMLTLISVPFSCLAGVKVYKKVLLDKRNTKLVLQFRDMLEAVSSSLGSGRNVKDAFGGALPDMISQYGKDAYIVKELQVIRMGIANNVNLEALLQDFAKRSHNENIQNFADVFSVANRRGGNIRQIVFETKNVISEKIMVEQDIQTVISGKKNELNIMMILPLIVVNQIKTMQSDTMEDFLFSFLVKLIAFCIFVAAYLVGQRMMKIEV